MVSNSKKAGLVVTSPQKRDGLSESQSKGNHSNVFNLTHYFAPAMEVYWEQKKWCSKIASTNMIIEEMVDEKTSQANNIQK